MAVIGLDCSIELVLAVAGAEGALQSGGSKIVKELVKRPVLAFDSHFYCSIVCLPRALAASWTAAS